MTPMNIDIAETIRELVNKGALFAVNHSAGKDSQVLLQVVREVVPADQIVVIHADLSEVEWNGTLEHARKDSEGLEFRVVKARYKDGSTKTLLNLAEKREMFPDKANRWCTSDLKRDPIARAIRAYLEEPGKEHLKASKIVVSCMGMRADESPDRAKLLPFERNERASNSKREWYDWLPIHDMKLEQVWKVLEAKGRDPHWAYKVGMSRLSCAFCILSNKSDLRTAALYNPELFKTYVELERQHGRSMLMPKKGLPQYLETVVGMDTEQVAQAMQRREAGESHFVRIEDEDGTHYIDVLDPACAHRTFHTHFGEASKESFLSGEPAFLVVDRNFAAYLTKDEIVSLMAGTMPADDMDKLRAEFGNFFLASEERFEMMPHSMPPAPTLVEAAEYIAPCMR
ncbi:phosphoadenosine phosphosulfate reductase family protein [Methylorubrum extorquens]|uniref:Phosphoadenosine phosphosulphate reductase domain-containing protein n=2 Tax=Methylorubrum extorquens TaxID=408 RepID=C5B6E0_METEA|nr:phosphoadenosine phosphosulfate reductase family protein [Methylorubrum extorquens]ACS44022.1 Conserved hypothetical protein [Methylorubrum extorquens AM1]EHP95032.1 phosphoadenosine phosphosulfate reductase [Methylorubrum extorquens DSM 13060]MCP1546111.1 3'-phosphoadenosine 5'-phosphosulfate sulfotransferase (PAPS reductase)/FAD synthetase [Methylorubrum extorquens]MCP1590778.1 3'-phosphoadenosine 5'-phosphosulfate sulfotransferase (PAPS reductase)/FAD synthetase [Methylorubrum extorquens]